MMINRVLIVLASVVFACTTGELLCSEELFIGLGGALPSPRSPSEYSRCVQGAVHTVPCPNGQYFDAHTRKCLFERAAQETRMETPYQFEELCNNPNVVEVFPNPTNCSQYIICYGLVPIEQSCTNGLLFNPQLNTCDIPSNVICGYSCPAVDDPYNPVWLPDSRLEDCSRHYLCFQGNPLQFYCYNNLYFDIVSRTCTYPQYSACTVPGVYCSINMNINVANPRSCTSYYACVDGFPHFRNCNFEEYFSEDLGVCIPGTCEPGTTTPAGSTTYEPTSTTVSSGTTPSFTSTTDINTQTTGFTSTTVPFTTSPSFTTPELTSSQISTTTMESTTMSVSETTMPTTFIPTTSLGSSTTVDFTTLPTVTESTTFVPTTPELTTSGETTTSGTPTIPSTTFETTTELITESTTIEISTPLSTQDVTTTTVSPESTTAVETATFPTMTESITFDPTTPELTTSSEMTTTEVPSTSTMSSTTLETTSELNTESTTAEISTQFSTQDVSTTTTVSTTSELTETTLETTSELSTESTTVEISTQSSTQDVSTTTTVSSTSELTQTTTVELTTTTTTEMVTIDPNEVCAGLGVTILPYPGNCYMYILCINGVGGVSTCAAGEIFNPVSATCVSGNQETCTLS